MKTLLRLLCAAFLISVSGCFNSGGADGDSKLIAAGAAAPDFAAMRADNTPVKLSDYRGKMVLVDFWATWCGPCKESMPHMEALHKQLESQGLVVLGVCVWDERASFDAWMKKPEVPTSYLKAFDPAGRGAESIAGKLYGVSGIPTFCLINKEGNVVFTGVGSGTSTEAKLKDALIAAGFKM